MIRKRKIDNRNHLKGLILDRHEKVDNWSKNIYHNIISKSKNYIFSTHPDLSSLYKTLSKFLKISEKNFIVTSGIDGATKQIFETFIKPKDHVIYLNPTWQMYEVYSSAFKAKSLKLDIDKKNFKINFKQLSSYMLKKPKVFFLSFPNSPIEVSISNKEIQNLINLCNKYNCLLVFDEAYHGFGSLSQINKYKKNKNIIINRSFSKSFGLTSIRLGYLISNIKIISRIQTKRLAYETNIFSSITAQHFIKNYKIVKDYNNEIIKSREWLKNVLNDKNIECHAINSMQLLIRLDRQKIKNIVSKLNKLKIYVKGPLLKPFDDTFVVSIGKKNTMLKFYKSLLRVI